MDNHQIQALEEVRAEESGAGRRDSSNALVPPMAWWGLCVLLSLVALGAIDHLRASPLERQVAVERACPTFLVDVPSGRSSSASPLVEVRACGQSVSYYCSGLERTQCREAPSFEEGCVVGF
jgi:hypothetical protein